MNQFCSAIKICCGINSVIDIRNGFGDWLQKKFNALGNDEIYFNLFQNNEKYPEALQKLDMYSLKGDEIKTLKLKTEFGMCNKYL